MQVSKAGIERIKAANDLAAIVAERGVELRRKGRQLVAPCPFHKERTASFNVSPAKGLYHCFGCGASGDVIGFVTKHDKVSFGSALETLAHRAGLDLGTLMDERPRVVPRAREVPANGKHISASKPPDERTLSDPAALLPRVVEHYHRTFCEREDAQAYLKQRGLADPDLWRAHRIGYANGSLLETIPRSGELREDLVRLGVITAEGRELLGGCVVVPIPDATSGQWTSLYGRGLRTLRHCYLPGPLRGVLNFHAARLCEEVVLTESIFDALSFHQVGVSVAIPIYGTNGFTGDHLDLLKRERVKRVTLALDSDDAGRRATDALKGKLEAAGIAVRVATFPDGTKDANALLVSRNGDAGDALRRCLDEAEPRPSAVAARPDPAGTTAALPSPAEAPVPVRPGVSPRAAAPLSLSREGVSYQLRVISLLLGRLRATVKAAKEEAFHVDTIDLYASRSRAEFARRASKTLTVSAEAVEAALLALLVEAEKQAEEHSAAEDGADPEPPMSDSERDEALCFLRRGDLLEQVAKDIDSLG
jgi:DNA primase catalytic core